MIKEHFTASAETINYKTFQEYFPDAKIIEIPLDTIPKQAMDFFEYKSAQFIFPDDYQPGNFSKAFLINHKDGSKTYVVEQTKEYPNSGRTERLTYFADADHNEVKGQSELVLNTQCAKEDEMTLKNKPYTGWTSTEESAQRIGLGTRRIFLMNAYAKMKYGLPLYSDMALTEKAKKMWEKLVQNGKAKKFKEGTHDRYVVSLGKLK